MERIQIWLEWFHAQRYVQLHAARCGDAGNQVLRLPHEKSSVADPSQGWLSRVDAHSSTWIYVLAAMVRFPVIGAWSREDYVQ